MSTLICGSIAFDSIMVFQDRFKDHILPEQVHILNVAFLVPKLRREFGGTAGNIAYNLKLLGGEPLPMATVGEDASAYLQRLDALGIHRSHVRQVADSYTAQAFITTDLDDNQITAFHPGAMSHSQLNEVPADGSIKLGIVAPDGRDGMLAHAAQFAEHGIPFVFDPGQGLPMFDADELDIFIDHATFVAVNDYEAQLLVEKTGHSLEALSRRVDALIVTRGGKGSDIFSMDGSCTFQSQRPAALSIRPAVAMPTAPASSTDSSTGWTGRRPVAWPRCIGALKIEYSGAQNHVRHRDEIAERFVNPSGSGPGENRNYRPAAASTISITLTIRITAIGDRSKPPTSGSAR